MPYTLHPADQLQGTIDLPADKSIGHRSALLSALADGKSRIVNYPTSADPQSTLACLKQLGVSSTDNGDGSITIRGRGLNGLRPPSMPVDCGNSGTTMRLLAGILAGQEFGSVLTGDASLKQRPLERLAEPLRAMGAHVKLKQSQPPIRIRGRQQLEGITYRLPMPSAQVKSCVLLAGLYAGGTTTVREPIPSRDHTERMLGINVEEVGGERHLTVEQGHTLPPTTWHVPGDFSAAAFFLVAGSIVPDSELHLPGVGINPTRSGLLDVLDTMGADITVENERIEGGEPLADLTVRSADLEATTISGAVIPNIIDEIPVLAVAAACAAGRTEIRDAEELRVKETDRLAAMARNLRTLGVSVREYEDGLGIEGPAVLKGATVSSFDDHRIAMAMGVAGLATVGPTTIDNHECAAVSFPQFWTELERVKE